jgi:hypothetical protein
MLAVLVTKGGGETVDSSGFQSNMLRQGPSDGTAAVEGDVFSFTCGRNAGKHKSAP